MAKSRRGVLFVGGEGPTREVIDALLRHAGMVVAADSGYDLARSLGVEPDLLVGDMDSIADFDDAQRLLAGKTERFERDKDETDTEIGLRLLHERGTDEVTIVGGGGGRLDHLLGIVALFSRPVHPKRWLTANDEVVFIEGREVFTGMRGRTCSFFPVGGTTARMKTTGLKWPLDELAWRYGDAGISNYAVSDRVAVSMVSGNLIMVRGLRRTPHD